MSERERHSFDGEITGLGTSSGVRCVVGRWERSPFGAFTDVMIETEDGTRVLIAPWPAVRDFVAATYAFDRTRVEPVSVTVSGRDARLRSESLRLDWTVGRRTGVGVLLAIVPGWLARRRAWARVISPVARLVTGSPTVGTAGGSRREWYCARSEHRVSRVAGEFDGRSLGGLARVDPPVRFGFASTPARPSRVSVTTWVEVPLPAPSRR